MNLRARKVGFSLGAISSHKLERCLRTHAQPAALPIESDDVSKITFGQPEKESAAAQIDIRTRCAAVHYSMYRANRNIHDPQRS